MAKLFSRALQSVSVIVGSEECGRVGKRRKAGCGLGLGLLQKRMRGFYNISVRLADIDIQIDVIDFFEP